MSLPLIEKVLVEDDRLLVQDKVGYMVYSGAESVNQQSFTPVANSVSQLSFNVNTPSLTSIIDRAVILRARVTFTVTGVPANGKYLCDFATGACGFQSFPLQQLCSSIALTINNTTVSTNLADVLHSYIRQLSDEDIEAANSVGSPVFPDNYASYDSAIGKICLCVF